MPHREQNPSASVQPAEPASEKCGRSGEDGGEGSRRGKQLHGGQVADTPDTG